MNQKSSLREDPQFVSGALTGNKEQNCQTRLPGLTMRGKKRDGSTSIFEGCNPLWGAPRIDGELLKLGIDVGQTSVAKYMARRRGPPSQGWKTFLRIQAYGIAAMDLFVVPTISFRLLYGLLIMGHGRRQILWIGGNRTSDGRMDRQSTDRVPVAGNKSRVI